MKTLLILLVFAVSVSCANKQKQSEQRINESKALCDRMYNLINNHDAGLVGDSLFKDKADSLRIAIDFRACDMTTAEWDTIKAYEEKLLDELILKKIKRDNVEK